MSASRLLPIARCDARGLAARGTTSLHRHESAPDQGAQEHQQQRQPRKAASEAQNWHRHVSARGSGRMSCCTTAGLSARCAHLRKRMREGARLATLASQLASVRPPQMLQCRGLNAHARPRRDRQAPAAAAGHGTASAPASKASPLGGFADYVWGAQARLCAQFEELDGGASFAEDPWTREDGSGRGSTRVLTGATWEKAACNVSVLSGVLTPQRAATMSQRGRPGVDPQGGQAYSAVALSLVFHARNPNLATFRADIRAFAVEGCDPFYGGGADLTPAYVFADDAAEWHAHWAAVCDAHQPPHAPPHALYLEYKKACDAYFYLPTRKEHRGIGGLFFDDVPPRPPTDSAAALSPMDGEAFARAVCENWVLAYAPIVARRREMSYGERERQWQLQRRGRYLEFNLLYDRGVRFGLDTGRIESIMVSAPPLVRCVFARAPPQSVRLRSPRPMQVGL